ncbi:MAG: hypothetical protein RI563_00815 [Thiohalophilus sp.]|uniref:hypothetical protein n=1 Tax=Thiohalophilus sp. TaxID=3028392 RepID=UPI0028707B0D|nr:hypothetical protein [Thiohalophilus sp.]MDR9435387.1 hypothetical protein [Thiohalophilus sp.]
MSLAARAHVAGAVVRFDANCPFVFKEIKNSPQTITPGELRVINMRNGEEFVVPDIRQLPFSGGEMISYEITLRLHRAKQSEVYSLLCRHDDDCVDSRHMKLNEMQQARGRFARIIKP